MTDATRTSINDLLERARARIPPRPGPVDAERATRDGALLLDIRSEDQRRRDGVIPGVPSYPRNVLEWRLDPASEAAVADHSDIDRRVILMCDAGFASSLAAETLQDLGFHRATDLDGGFQAWRAAGLPVEPYPGE
jgi:rhodanese-related sulfurtransferase